MWSYRPALDGLRTVAIYLVLLFHAGLTQVSGGFIGVDVFFVLSGFLVSNVILSEHDRTGTLGLGAFYSRRIRRLLPAAVLVIISTVALFLIIGTVVRRLPMIGDAQASLLYVANWHFLASANDYFAAENDPSPFLHFWSLSIEEQFYFFFPALFLLISRTGATWERTLTRVVTVLVVASVASQLVWAQVSANHAYYGTDARIYQLLAGVLLALVLRRWAGGEAASGRQRPLGLLATVGIVAMAVLASGLVDLTPTWRGLGATVSSVAVIAGLTLVPGSWLTRLLSLPVPVYLGKISYGTYLWHWPVILALKEFLRVSPVTIAVLAFALSTGLAALSFQIFESPIRRARVLNRFGWSVLAVGVLTSALVAVLVPGVLDSQRKPSVVASSSGQVTRDVDISREGRRPVPDIDFEQVSADVGAVRTCPADQPEQCTVVRGDGPHLLMVGDSQAEMFGPMLAELARERNFTFSENVLSGCAWTIGLVNTRVTEQLQARCAANRDDWYEQALPKLDPDVVLLVQKPREDEMWGDLLVNADGSGGTQSQKLSRATRRTLELLEKGPWKVLVLESALTPGRFRVVECLASAKTVGQCAVPLPRTSPDADAYYRAAAAEYDDISTANINPVVCPRGPLCLPIRGGAVVWRDREHLTVSFTQRFRNQIWAELKKSGALRGFE